MRKNQGLGWVAAACGVLAVIGSSRSAFAYDFSTGTERHFTGGNPVRPDAPISMLQLASGDPYWLFSGTGHNTYQYRAPVSNLACNTGNCAPFVNLQWQVSSTTLIVGVPSPYTEAWISSIYRHTDGGVLGFIHLETGGSNEDFAFGLAYSDDDGLSWTFCGIILDENDASDLDHNIQGGAYMIRNEGGTDYFYAYYEDLVSGVSVPAVARAPVASVMTAAALNSVTAWTKYNLGSWVTGVTAAASPINTPYAPGSSSHMAFDTTLNRYIWLNGDAADTTLPNEVYAAATLLFSEDGLNWSGRRRLYEPAGLEITGSYSSLAPATPSSNYLENVAQKLGQNIWTYYCYGTDHTVGKYCEHYHGAPLTFSPFTSRLSANFNTMTANADPSGWSVYESGAGDVFVTPNSDALQKNIRISDTSTTAPVSTAKTITTTSDAVSFEFEFKLDDAGSRQTFRLKGNGSTVNAVHVYAFSGKLYWLDGTGSGHVIPSTSIAANTWYTLKVVAHPSTDTYDIIFDGRVVPNLIGAAFENAVTSIDAVAFSTGTTGVGDLYIDDLEVYE